MIKKLPLILVILFLAGVFFQTVYLLDEYGPNLLGIRANLGKSGSWRGAYFNQSGKVADYIEFLEQNIPENARVVLPSLGGNSKILRTPYMQFFLAPREVINCTDEDCLLNAAFDRAYILYLVELPPEVLQGRNLMMFDDHWGLIAANNSTTMPIQNQMGFESWQQIILVGIIPLLWIALLTFAGAALTWLIFPTEGWLFLISCGYGFGLGLFSMLVVTVNLLGFMLSRTQMIVTALIFFGICIFFFFWQRSKFKPENLSLDRKINTAGDILWPLAFFLVGGVTTLLAVGKGYHIMDSIQIWGAKGYGIAAAGTVKNITHWGTNTLAYPLHIPVVIASFRVLFADPLPSSKLIFSGYALFLSLFAYLVLLRLGVRRMFAGLGVILLMTAPIFFRHATVGFVNLVTAYYLVSGVLIFAFAWSEKFPKYWLFFSGMQFVLAAWSRPEALILAFTSLILLSFPILADRTMANRWSQIFSLITPLFFYSIFWGWVKTQVYPVSFQKTDLVSVAIKQNLTGNIHFSELFYIIASYFQILLSVKLWGWVGIFFMVMCLIVLIMHRSIPRPARILVAVGGVFIVLIFAMYYLTSYDPQHDLSWWVNSGLDRMTLPGMILIWFGLVYAVDNLLAR